MKKKLYIISAVLFMGAAMGGTVQAQSQECTTNLSIFVEHAKVKNYEAAYTPWKTVYDNCPDYHYAIYAYGEKILNDKIDKASGAEKEGYIKELLSMYDNYQKYFPKRTSVAGTAIDKILLQYDNKMIDDAGTYEGLDKAFKSDLENFTNPKALYLYFSSLVNLHEAGKKDLQEVFDVYDAVMAKISDENDKLTDSIGKLLPKEEDGSITSKEKQQLKVYNSYSESYGKIEGSIDTKLGKLADCDNLIPLYEKNFEEKKGDVNWVKSAVSRMYSKDCTDDPMFKKLFQAQLALVPSADAYVYAGVLDQKAGNNSGAIENFNKALQLETDAKKKSNIALKIAHGYRNSSKSQAYSFAQKAVNANPSNGKAYLLMANLVAGSANECGDTPFDKRAVYWKAAELARKAARVDPSLSGHASQSAASYDAKAPTKEMIFSSGMSGKTVSFSCWVGGSVKVPSL